MKNHPIEPGCLCYVVETRHTPPPFAGKTCVVMRRSDADLEQLTRQRMWFVQFKEPMPWRHGSGPNAHEGHMIESCLRRIDAPPFVEFTDATEIKKYVFPALGP